MENLTQMLSEIEQHNTEVASKIQAYLKLGNTLKQKHQDQDALACYQAAYALDHSNVTTSVALSKAYIAVHETALALEVLEPHLQAEKINLHIGLNVINVLNICERYLEGENVLTKLESTYPNSFHVKFKRAQQFQINGLFNEAISAYDALEFVANNEQKIFLVLANANARTQIGKTQEAIVILKKVLSEYPDNIHLISKLITLLIEQQEYEEASNLCASALKENPSNLKLKLFWAQLLDILVSTSESVKFLESMTAEEKNSPFYYLHLSRYKTQEGEIIEAHLVLKEGLEKYPQNIFLQESLSINYKNRGQFEKAIMVLDSIGMHTAQEESRIALNKGLNYLHRYNYSEAQRYIELSQKKYNNAISKIKLSGIYSITGKIDEAYDLLSQATRDVKDNLSLLNGIKPLRSHAAMICNEMRSFPSYMMALIEIEKITDDKCLQHLDKFDLRQHGFIAGQEVLSCLGNNFIASAPGHPIVKRALELVERNLLEYSKESAWFKTGPAVLTLAAAQYFSKLDLDQIRNDETFIIDQSGLRQFVFQHMHMAYKRTDQSWFRKEYM